MNRDLFSAARGLRADLDAVDWDASPLGPVDGWSPALRNAVDLMMHSTFPMTLLWGPQFALIYNDAYVQLIGDKHPRALGAPARDAFAEAWDQIGPMLAQVSTSGTALAVEDELVPLWRHGFLEDCFFTFSYSAVRGAEGLIEGVIDVVSETTGAVKGRRRVERLARLSESLVDATSTGEVRQRALAVLSSYGDDLVSVDVRLAETDPADWATDLPTSAPSSLSARSLVIDEPAGDDARNAWAVVEHGPSGEPASILVARLNPRTVVDDDLGDSITLTAAVIGRALGRMRAEVVAQSHRDLERQLSEALQRSLLTHPPRLEHMQVAVRYVPAAMEAQVGGDWYDAFMLPSGELSLVIGDVTGHDREAAAGMAQLRNLLRGVSMTLNGHPAAILASLESALYGLAIDIIATGILVQVDPTPVGDIEGHRTLRWTNAGHPFPVLILPDGSVELLHTDPDPMLGVGSFERTDHSVSLAPGATLVLYTDGLMERRGQHLDEGFAWLEDVLSGQQHLDAEAVCDLLIEHMPPGVEDDVALLVLRAGR